MADTVCTLIQKKHRVQMTKVTPAAGGTLKPKLGGTDGFKIFESLVNSMAGKAYVPRK